MADTAVAVAPAAVPPPAVVSPSPKKPKAAAAPKPAPAPTPAPTPATAPKSNFVFADKNELLKEVRKLGTDSAKSAIARPEFIVNTALAAEEGTIQAKPYDHESKKKDGKAVRVDDVADVWDAFSNSEGKSIEGVAVHDGKQSNYRKVRISELRKVAEVAEKIEGFSDLLDTTVRPLVFKLKADDRYKGNMQDAFIKVARGHLKRDDLMSEEELVKAIVPDPADKERTEKSELEKLLKLAEVIRDGTEPNEKLGTPGKEAFPSDHLDQIIELIEERVKMVTLTTGSNGSLHSAGY